ncbi:MAG TPA: vitamin K epoxide reductase family protein [Burkholderiales bacterium]|nr:vitamin K epoxide reductase family protein [Burkholderiales bacterium]
MALIGIADASYDSYAIYAGQALWCPPPIDGCNTVATSPYARILGVPLGYLGVIYYVGMVAVSALLASAPLSPSCRALALAYATAGVLASSVFFYIQANYIHAFCIYCMVSAFLTVLLFVTSLIHYRRTRNANDVRDGSSPRLARLSGSQRRLSSSS